MIRYLFSTGALLLLFGLQPVNAAEWIVGIAISNNDRTYAWFSDGVVTSGSPTHFETHKHAEAFKLPAGRKPSDIVAIAIAKSNDRVYTWFKDGKVVVGSTKDLASHVGPRNYTLPPGKTVADIAGIGIAPDGRVYAWYKDGTVSVGSSIDLDRHSAPSKYTLPAGVTFDDITEIDVGPDGHVYGWYRMGLVSEGTTEDLDLHESPRGFVPVQVVYRSWGPRFRRQPDIGIAVAGRKPYLPEHQDEEAEPADSPFGRTGARPDLVEAPDLAMTKISPAPAAGPFLATTLGRSLDPMIAVGHRFIILSDTGSIAFYDKRGNLLPTKNGVPTHFTTEEFFGGFVAKTNADGSFNDRNINLYLGFPKPCDTYPQTRYGNHFCFDDFYDTRVQFDPATRRFFIMSNSRHQLSEEKGRICMTYNVALSQITDTSDCVNKNDDSINDLCKLTSDEYCDLPRRLVAFAVSKTDDPRDGFHQYILTENEFRDWPWMAVNGDHFVVAHKGEVDPDSPAIIVFSTGALKLGKGHPPYFRYSNPALVGAKALPPGQHGPVGEPTLLLSMTSGRLDIFAFPKLADPWQTPTPLEESVELGDHALPTFGAVYRNGYLYGVGRKEAEELDGAKRFNVRIVRLPVTVSASSITVSTNPADGFLDRSFGLRAPGDPADSRINYNHPSMAVNAVGDMLFAYHREPFAGPAIFPEARYTLWRMGEPTWHWSRVLKVGEGQANDKIDYTTAVVDPSDNRSFWVALPYGKSGGGYRTAFGKVKP
ncbi:MAG TPA: hypothetical protein VFZ40_13835 [Pyrinomonadaceae bacterium]